MGFFNGRPKRQPTLVPSDALLELDEIGRKVFTRSEPVPTATTFIVPALKTAGMPQSGSREWSEFQDRFYAELLSAASSQGGWAYAGAFHVACDWNFQTNNEDFRAIMNHALRFLKEAGVPSERIPSFAIPRWNEVS